MSFALPLDPPRYHQQGSIEHLQEPPLLSTKITPFRVPALLALVHDLIFNK